MRNRVASELLKLRTTSTTAGLMATMTVLVVTAVFLHGYGLPAERLQDPADRLSLLIGWGALLGALFAGLAGAICFTAELRFGTIRPTILVTPRRGQLIAAKALVSAATGSAFGLMATVAASITGKIAISARGLDDTLDNADYVQFILGGAFSGALWAMVGLGVGAVVRSQVPTVVGLLAWVLFVEGVLVDNAPSVGRFAPSALGQSISGLYPDKLLTPIASAPILTIYATAAVALGTVSVVRRDFT